MTENQFELPRYEEIPNVGLYLEQTTKYIAGALAPLHCQALTASMISNYVKKKLVSNPVKKQYDREQIAYLLAIAVLKTVLSLEDIGVLLEMMKAEYTTVDAYRYFCGELRSTCAAVFEQREAPLSADTDPCRHILHTAVTAVAHKLYLDACMEQIRAVDSIGE